jgi:Flp pilus assembly protein TadG
LGELVKVDGRQPRGERGAQVVEFALIVPIVLVIIGAIVQFGFIYNAQVTVTQAAREGARLAAICGASCSSGPIDTSTKNAAPGLDPSQLTVTIMYCPAGGSCTGAPGAPAYCPANATQATGDAEVVVSYPESLGAPLLSYSFAVKGKARMPCGG